MFAGHNTTLLEILRTSHLLDEGQLAEIGSIDLEPSGCVYDEVLRRKLATRSNLLAATAVFLGCSELHEMPVAIPPALAAVVPANLALRYRAVPVEAVGRKLRVIAVDPFDPDLVPDLSFACQREVELAICDPTLVAVLLESTYGGGGGAGFEDIPLDLKRPGTSQDQDLRVSENFDYTVDEPVVRLVDEILSRAVRDGASDVHFEPYEDVFRVRYRVDGTLYDLPPPAQDLAVGIISRIKVLADLNIAERRVPQDGRLRIVIEEREIDLRVSTLPTQFGESVVLRILDKSALNLDLDQLGIPNDVCNRIRQVARRPNGVFIVTGPTGSGKTTTLYSTLREVNNEERKILTAEDPVEYEIEGLVQTAINPAIGLTFATALRAFLRQDPDKILVGEIRDPETARIAAQAALTGHLVFTTLHTTDAASAVTRLVDMGLERYLIAASLEAVLAQRLVRRNCPQCRAPDVPEAATLAVLGLTATDVEQAHFARGRGCEHCHGTGFAGRLGIFEMIDVDDHFRELITAGASTHALRGAAESAGTRSLFSEGRRLVMAGETTADEVVLKC